MATTGKPKRKIHVEPLRTPRQRPLERPQEAPARPKRDREPVPA